jgi:hypothetical protein
MPSDATSDTEVSRLPGTLTVEYKDEEVTIYLMRTAGVDYSDTTTVYRRNYSDTFHADEKCPRLLAEAGSNHMRGGESKAVHLRALSLPRVLSTWCDPIKACSHCTLSMQETARVAVQQDGLSAYRLKLFERGEKKYTTMVRRDPETGETTVSQHSKVVE